MKTRDEIYVEEREIVRVVSAYKVLHRSQVQRLFPKKSSGTVDNMLRKLARSKRVFVDWQNGFVAAGNEMFGTLNQAAVKSFWLLLEFIDKVTYHTPTEFPAQIFFITEKDNFEIIYVADGQEAAVNAFFLKPNSQDICKRLVIVDDISQIQHLHIPAVSAYTTVTADGNVTYYKY